MAFHRFTVPNYTGGLPGGYDYINNAVVGTPALVAGPRADGGPNNGTYFVGFGEDGRSVFTNRGLAALAENTDHLDDLLRRDLAVCAITSLVTAPSPTSAVTLIGPGIFLGAVGTPNTAAGINTFIEILDNEDKEIIDASGVRCVVTSISGGSVGSGGFSAGNVTLTVTPAIPTGKQYRVYYGIRGNLATLPVDALTNIKIRSAQEVSALLEAPGGAALVGAAAGPAWLSGTTNPAATVQAKLDKIITDLSTQVANSGAAKIGAYAYSTGFHTFMGNTVAGQLSDLIGWIENNQAVRTLATSSGGPYNLSIFNKNIFIDTSSGIAFNFQLPNPATCAGRRFYLASMDAQIAAGREVTLVRFGSETIDGIAADYVLNVPEGRWILMSNGTNWFIWSC